MFGCMPLISNELINHANVTHLRLTGCLKAIGGCVGQGSANEVWDTLTYFTLRHELLRSLPHILCLPCLFLFLAFLSLFVLLSSSDFSVRSFYPCSPWTHLPSSLFSSCLLCFYVVYLFSLTRCLISFTFPALAVFGMETTVQYAVYTYSICNIFYKV